MGRFIAFKCTTKKHLCFANKKGVAGRLFAFSTTCALQVKIDWIALLFQSLFSLFSKATLLPCKSSEIDVQKDWVCSLKAMGFPHITIFVLYSMRYSLHQTANEWGGEGCGMGGRNGERYKKNEPP